jgi:hypothetical protein
VSWSFVYFQIDNYLRCGCLPENWKDWIVTFNSFFIALLLTAVAIKGRVPRILAGILERFLFTENKKK